MSVDRRDYIIYGWKLPYDIAKNIWDDKFLPLIEGHKSEEFIMIADQMCGKYVVFGYKIMSNDYGWGFNEIKFEDYSSINLRLKNRYSELFDSIPETEPTVFIFSNFC